MLLGADAGKQADFLGRLLAEAAAGRDMAGIAGDVIEAR